MKGFSIRDSKLEKALLRATAPDLQQVSIIKNLDLGI